MRAGILTAPRPAIPQVTLVAVTSVALNETALALQRSAQQADFAEVVLLSDRLPDEGLPACVTWRQIPALSSRSAYSRFLFSDLLAHASTSHMLVVQWDGFVIQGDCWNPGFLEYDYIGAPWPQFGDGMAVGNGGFSLRSRRLLEALTEYGLEPGEPEDIAICRRLRPVLEARHSIRFAPIEVARAFAFERLEPTGSEFGFHGVTRLPQVLGPAGFLALLDQLDPLVFRRNEINEMIRETVRRGDLKTALKLVRRRLLGQFTE